MGIDIYDRDKKFYFLNPGDTTLNLADVFPLGKVVAFEMGPPMEILRLNVR